MARRDLPSGTVHYYFSDHLKSVSLVTSAAGTIEDESDYTPWGEERRMTSTLADQHFKFNGKERVSISEDSCVVRFHQCRKGEQWLADDLEGYAEEAVLVLPAGAPPSSGH